jgi:hypothetical protein
VKAVKDFMKLHEDYLRRVVPADRLYFYNVKDGWEPLCKILGCPVPDIPFPHSNEIAAMRKHWDAEKDAAKQKWWNLLLLPVTGIWGFVKKILGPNSRLNSD